MHNLLQLNTREEERNPFLSAYLASVPARLNFQMFLIF